MDETRSQQMWAATCRTMTPIRCGATHESPVGVISDAMGAPQAPVAPLSTDQDDE